MYLFESMFSPEALAERDRQEALNQYRASQIYAQARKDNPRMLEPYIDFSNPEQLAQMQQPQQYPYYGAQVPPPQAMGAVPNMANTTILNPYGYTNPYMNPNLIQQNQWMNPNMFNRPAYGGTWYGGSPMVVNAMDDNLDSFMIPRPGSKYEFKVKIVRGEIKKPKSTTPRPEGKTYIERLINGVKNAKVRIVRGGSDSEEKKEEKEAPILNQQNRRIPYTIYKPPVPKHEPGTPYTDDELVPDRTYIKVISETPLNWTQEDDAELEKICKEVAVYDKALAHCGWNIPTFKGCTREDYEYFKLYLLNVAQDYKSKELMNPKIDYRAPYRNRPLPPTVEDPNSPSGVRPDMSKPVPVVLKRIGLGGKPDYEYDRGRELTQEEWDIFVDRAYFEMMDGAKRIMGRDLMELNKDLAQPQQKQEAEEKYNPYDPIACRVHAMKEEKKAYNTNMEFFRYALRHKFNDEEFNAWWFGTPLQSHTAANNSQQMMDQQQAYARDIWAQQMTARNIQYLENFVPFDPIREREWANTVMYNAINQFTQGSVTRDMSAMAMMENLVFLNNRIHMMEVERQQAEAARQSMFMTNRQTYQTALQNFANYGPCSTNSPGWMGTQDPRTPSNGQVVDLNSMLQTEQFKQFENHCLNSNGHVQLSAVYR